MLNSNTYNQYFPQLSPEQLAENAKKKVIIGMSGGVDSSVSAFILQQQGYQVEGLFMKNWEEDDEHGLLHRCGRFSRCASGSR